MHQLIEVGPEAIRAPRDVLGTVIKRDQAEARCPHAPANDSIALEHIDVETGTAQHPGAGKASETGTNNGDV